MTDQEREEFEFRLRAEQEAEQAKDGVSKFEEYTGVSPSSPLLGGAVGVVAGIPAGRILEGAAKGATAPLPRTTVAGKTGASSGDKWLRNYANINKPNFSGGVPEAASIYQRTKGHGPVSEKVTQRFGPGAKLDIESYSRAQKARPFMERVLSKTPEAVQRAGQAISGAGASVPAWLGRGIAGGSAGFQGVDAANRFEQGDYLGAAIGGLGALGSGAALIPHPLTRGLGTAVGTAAPFINEYLDRRRKRQEEQPEENAEGVFGFSEGGGTPKKRVAKAIVDTAVGKTPKAIDDIIDKFKARTTQTVKNPLRMDYPGIYERPDIIAQRAVQNTAPESPLLKQLFGVSRGDLYEMSKRKGNMPGVIPGAAKNPKGSAAVESIMTPQNEQRILDIMSELQTRAPGMYQGMHGWYTMDPEYQRLVQLVGKDEAGRLYRQLNTFGGIESPNMPVPNEFRRASAAHMMAEQNRFPEWMKYGGIKAEDKPLIANYPSDLMSVPGRVGHARASKSQNKYIETGLHGMDSPKAPPYIEASSVPELGFQTDLLVGDAHLSRGVGLADVRTGKSTAESVSTPELQQMAPWWREKIAKEMETEAVPAQAILWGGLGPYTGVKTAVGAPKLELHAIEIGNAAKRLGVSPETARDLILMGKERAGKAEGGLAHMASGGSKC